MRNQQDAQLQLDTALNFLDMAGDDKHSSRNRKRYLLTAFMHAKNAAVIAACIDNAKFEFWANNVASDCIKALNVLLDCATIDQGLEELRRARRQRQEFDKSIGLNVADYSR